MTRSAIRQHIVAAFDKVKTPKDDRHKALIDNLADTFCKIYDEGTKKAIEDFIMDDLSEFDLVHSSTSKIVSVSHAATYGDYEVREYNDLSGKEYKTLKGAINAASK